MDASSELARVLALLHDAEEERDLLKKELVGLREGVHSPLLGSMGLGGPPSPRPQGSLGPSEAPAGFSVGGGGGGGGGGRGVAMVSTPHNLRLAEERAMRNIFAEVAGEDGCLGGSELAQLHGKLGDPLTEKETQESVGVLGGKGGRITFESFLSYWHGTHTLQRGYSEASVGPAELARERERKRQRYFRRFKLTRRGAVAARLDRVFTEEVGAPNTLEWRLFWYTDVAGEKQRISPWHDIPLMNEDGTLNMIVEIPRWTRRKIEIATMEEYNPLKLDSKNGMVRILKYGDQLFNYGAFPQTWESPQLWTEDDTTGSRTRGDNDPIDVVEIGAKQHRAGSIVRVKVLGVLGLIDAGETDWKVFAMSVDDPLAARINTLEDMKLHMPGALEAERDYLRFYKEDINTFLFGGEVKDEVSWVQNDSRTAALR